MNKSILLHLLISCSLTISFVNPYAYAVQETPLAKKIDELVMQHLSTVAPGVVVLVARKGEVLYKKAFGLANLASDQPMQTDMIFRIGSITKQFTAIATLQLVEQGKIRLQDTVQQFIADFPIKEYPITIENLLTQTSGIINYFAIENPDSPKLKETYTPAQGVDFFQDEPLQFIPGTKFDYSNSNYYLLGYIIEKVSGQSYSDYLQEHILTPAGLKYTYYIDTGKNIPEMASAYSRFDGKVWEKAALQHVTHLYAAGALMSNATDLLKWHLALQEGKLLSKALLAKAYRPFILSGGSISPYSYGWFIRQLDGSPTIEHSGSTDGYQTNAIYLPKEDVYVISMFNGFEEDMDWMILSNDIARLATGKPLRKDTVLTDDKLKRYAGTYFFNDEHQLIVTYKDHQLFVEAVNPKDRLPRVRLYAKSDNRFYMKEAVLEFEFEKDPSSNSIKLTTYNSGGKDAEWKKIK